jgi:hypothetical protein
MTDEIYRGIQRRMPSAAVLKFSREDSMLELVLEFWQFMRQRKKFWLIPIVGCLLILGTLMALSATPVVAPFIYALF